MTADRAANQPLRVVVVGESSLDSPCDFFRTSMFAGPLASLDVDIRYSLPSVRTDGPLDRHELERQTAAGVDRLRADVEDAHVVVFRRAYFTHLLCLDCAFATLDGDAAAAHVRASGHVVDVAPDLAVRRLFDILETDPIAARRLAIVYETDDDLFDCDPLNGQFRAYAQERDLIERMIRRADLVTTSTSILARRLAPLAAEVRVVRNAVDPAWYAEPSGGDGIAADGAGQPVRVLYYGTIGRLRDYAECAPAVNRMARQGAWRVWLGAPGIAAEVARVAAGFDEIHPYVAGAPAFARRLAELRPAIGLAPLTGSPYDRAKSELHWLEYSMAGAATVATRLKGGGPYDVIRDGVDGLLASTPSEWRSALSRLVGSAQLRGEIVAQARARVLADYSVDARAVEWAHAYRSASGQTGRGLANVRAGAPSSARAAAPGRKTRPSVHDGGRGGEPASPAPIASPVAAILAAYLAAQAFAGRSPLRLLLGTAGSAIVAGQGRAAADGWITIDTAGEPDLHHDVAFGLPFADGSVEAVEARHVIDGLGDLAGLLAAEALRVLRPGGSLRVLTTDRAPVLAAQQALQVEGVSVVGRAARLPVFTAATLGDLLVRAGFAAVVREPSASGELLLMATR